MVATPDGTTIDTIDEQPLKASSGSEVMALKCFSSSRLTILLL